MLDKKENDETINKTHSRHNTELLEYKRLTKYNNNKNDYIDDRKTVDFYENNINIYDDSESEDGDDISDMNNETSLGAILGIQLDKFNKENNGMILNEEGNNLVNNLKKENLKKYSKTGKKFDFVEEVEGKSFSSKRTYRELERYISNLNDDNENKGEEYIFSSGKRLSKKFYMIYCQLLQILNYSMN